MKKKNAFTLIELLAVIVILAIIALIATPIILGIVEDAKKDAFVRSVELVVSTTDIDVMSKLTDNGYEYELIDGKIVDTVTEDYNSVNKEKCNAIPQWEYLELNGIDVSTVCDNVPNEMFDGLTLTEYAKTDFPWERWLKNYDALEITKTYNELNIAKNTQGMNGSIVYDKDGNETYAIHNEKYCVVKMKNKTQKVIVYEEGKCEIEEALTNGMTFSEMFSQVSTEGSSIISGDGQLINLGKYGIRFQGNNPNNYVTFNNELWRIIGVVDGNIKIVRSKSLESMSWDDPGNDFDMNDQTTWDGDNNWSDSTLQTYLNGEYYNSIDATSKSMIQASTWYLRGNNTPRVTKYDMYDLERTTGTLNGTNPEKIENTNIGLLYPSDWGFGAMETDSCLSSTTLYEYRSCGPTNWLSSELVERLITPRSSFSDYAFFAGFNFGVGPYVNSSSVLNPCGVRPVLNLISNVRLSGGMGTKESPYTLSAE